MLSDCVCQDPQKSSDSESIVSVLISNYPLSNGGYLVSFGKDDPEGSFRNFDPVYSLDFDATKLSKFLDFSSIFLPKGCFYLAELALTDFIRFVSSCASFDMKLLPASGQLQGLLLIKVDEASLFRYEQEEED